MVRQYVGARYVPKFADPVAWASGTSYEAMTIVTYNNSSYTSKIPVPATVGNPADNPDYWALTGNYNAQVEEYRKSVENLQGSNIDVYADGYSGTLDNFSAINGYKILQNNKNNGILRVMTLNAPIWHFEEYAYFDYRALADYYLMLCSIGANVYGTQEYAYPITLDTPIPIPTGTINYQYFQPTLKLNTLEYLNWGNNILSTEQGDFTSKLYNGSAPSEQRGFEKIIITYAGKNVSIYNTHLNASENTSQYRSLELSELAQNIANDTNSVIIVTGDFNFSPNDNFDTFFAPLINAGLKPVNKSIRTWPRTNSTWMTDNIWYKGCTASNVTFIDKMPNTLNVFDHKGIFADFAI